MKIRVTAASSCLLTDEQKKALLARGLHNEDGSPFDFEKDEWQDQLWGWSDRPVVVEMSSVEELFSLVKELGESVILESTSGDAEIKIYNYYIE